MYKWVLPKKIKFILLGSAEKNDALILKEKIAELRISENFILFDRYINSPQFNTYLSLADCVLPLLAENSLETKLYLTCKVSGA